MSGICVGIYSPGTVGKRVIHALLRLREKLGVREVIVFKLTPDPEYMSVLEMMRQEGARFAFQADRIDKFAALGLRADYEREEALSRVQVLIDCSSEGVPLKFKPYYEKVAPQCRLFACQGAEEDRGFGKGPFVYGVNDSAFDNNDRWIQIGSCNTHAGSFILKALAFPQDEKGDIQDTGFEEAFFVFIRRALDLNQKSKTVISTEVSPSTSDIYGTHHAEDIAGVFRLKGIELEGRILSSAIKINEPYFHTVDFAITFRKPLDRQDMARRLMEERQILMSRRRLAHYNFEFGTSHGFMGRFSNPVIVVHWNIFQLKRNRWQIRGHAFTPQDGNFLLSNLALVARVAFPPFEFAEKMRQIEEFFLSPIRQI